MFKYFLVIAALVPAVVFGARVTQCLDGSPLPINVTIDACGDVAVCDLVRGKDASMWLRFDVLDDMVKPTARVIATAVGVTTTFPLPEDVADVCKNLERGECPIEAEQEIVYNMNMHVSVEFPITPLVLEVSVIDDVVGTPVHTCFRLQAQTVDV